MVSRITHPCLSFPYKDQLKFRLATFSSLKFWSLIDYLSYHLPALSKWYEKAIQQEYFKEYQLLHLAKKPVVLHIGCGSYPLTDLTLADATTVKHVIGIDNDHQAVEHARNIISLKGLQDIVSIEEGDGTNYDIKQFDVIIVSSCSWPKVFILDHLFSHAKPGCLFIIRELDLAVKPIFQCIKKHNELKLKELLYHHPFPFVRPFGWQTFFLKKGKQ